MARTPARLGEGKLRPFTGELDYGYGLLTLRAALGESQTQFGQRLGVTARAIQAYEHNEYRPSPAVAQRILDLHIADGDD